MYIYILNKLESASYCTCSGLTRSGFNPMPSESGCIGKTINRSHAHRTHRQRKHPRHRQHTRTTRPQTNTSHKHLTTLNGGATTVRATSHARVGGRAEVSMRGRVEV